MTGILTLIRKILKNVFILYHMFSVHVGIASKRQFQHVLTTYIQRIRDVAYAVREARNNKNINDNDKYIRI